MAMPCFFFVAGFLIMKGLLRRKERFDNWIKRRLQRLWPAVFLWAVIAAMVWVMICRGRRFWLLLTIAACER